MNNTVEADISVYIMSDTQTSIAELFDSKLVKKSSNTIATTEAPSSNVTNSEITITESTGTTASILSDTCDLNKKYVLELLKLGKSSIVIRQEQLAELERLQSLNLLRVDNMTTAEWFQLMWNNGKPLLFDNYIDEDNLFTDQLQRAEYLVSEMKCLGIKKLRTMDGHGRFLTCVLAALFKIGEDADTYEIEIYDIDYNANTWHMKFFPKNIVVAQENILQEYEGIYDTMIYLNFCSIGSQILEIREFFKTAYQYNPIIKIMMSFSTRGTTHFGNVGVFLKELSREYGWNYLCNRSNFFSGFVTGIKNQRTTKKDDNQITHIENINVEYSNIKYTIPTTPTIPRPTTPPLVKEIHTQDDNETQELYKFQSSTPMLPLYPLHIPRPENPTNTETMKDTDFINEFDNIPITNSLHEFITIDSIDNIHNIDQFINNNTLSPPNKLNILTGQDNLKELEELELEFIEFSDTDLGINYELPSIIDTPYLSSCTPSTPSTPCVSCSASSFAFSYASCTPSCTPSSTPPTTSCIHSSVSSLVPFGFCSTPYVSCSSPQTSTQFTVCIEKFTSDSLHSSVSFSDKTAISLAKSEKMNNSIKNRKKRRVITDTDTDTDT
jgi:hypothetical protein